MTAELYQNFYSDHKKIKNLSINQIKDYKKKFINNI